MLGAKCVVCGDLVFLQKQPWRWVDKDGLPHYAGTQKSRGAASTAPGVPSTDETGAEMKHPTRPSVDRAIL